MIKLFASDLDGTLLNATHMVDPFIRASLREVVASGAHFAIATGRTMRSNHDCGFGGVDAEVVCSNGSIVLDRTGRTVYHRDLDKGFLEELLKAFPAVCFECVGTDRTYVTGSPNDQVAGYVGRMPVEKVKMAAMRLRRKMMQGDCVMLERFAHSYAPSNACDAAKRAAGRVIGSCACYAVPRHMVATVRAQ